MEKVLFMHCQKYLTVFYAVIYYQHEKYDREESVTILNVFLLLSNFLKLQNQFPVNSETN